MLLVIFGAGASYDSFRSGRPPNYANQRPPLSNELFAQRFGDDYRLFPQCQAIIYPLQEQGVNVENVLEKFQQKAFRDYPMGLSQLTAVRYYLGYMIWRCQSEWTNSITKGVTNYKYFIDQIGRRLRSIGKVCLVTFNYDTLLDEALTDRGFNFKSTDDYVGKDFQLIKLHGSINWAHEIKDFPGQGVGTQTEMIQKIIDNAPSLRIEGNSFKIVNGNPFERTVAPLFPALAIPVQNKSSFECPESHLKVFQDSLAGAERVIMIGWKAGENRFLKMLAEGIPGDTPTIVVSSSRKSASETITARISPSMRSAHVHADITAANGGFSDFIFSPELNEFLND